MLNIHLLSAALRLLWGMMIGDLNVGHWAERGTQVRQVPPERSGAFLEDLIAAQDLRAVGRITKDGVAWKVSHTEKEMTCGNCA